MTFLLLNDIAKAFIITLCILSTMLIFIAFIFSIAGKSKGHHIALLFVLYVINILNYASLVHLYKIGRVKYNTVDIDVYPAINNLPFYLHIIFFVIIIVVAVVALFKIYKRSKNAINTFSVKQALENLPTGIAFMQNSQKLMLSNHIMHNLCKELTGKILRNAEDFWQELQVLQRQDNCMIKGNEPAFILKSGNIWQFSKKTCIIEGDRYQEFQATDITELYNLSENTRKVNAKLMQQHKRLKELANIIEDNVESQVAVNMKINFHDKFGNLLTLTKKTLRENANVDEERALVDYWGNLNDVIKELSSNDRQNLSLEQIMLFADKLSCKIVLSGELPTDKHNKLTVLLCINEMLKNAYRHAEAQEIIVEITQTDKIIELKIQNETENELTHINEGSGLLGLRRRIEQAGGTMKMICDEGVSMLVTLIKEEDIAR